MQKAIGILGGTFNPIHNGHLQLAEAARAQFQLNQILFMPNGTPPHRNAEAEHLFPKETRYLLCVLATLSNPHFLVSRVELDSPEPSYTYNTIQTLKKQNPGNRYFFISGTDSLIHHTWVRFNDLLQLLDGFLLAPRAGDISAALEKIKESAPQVIDKIKTIHMNPIPISATDIRARIEKKQTIRSLVPESVALYLEKYIMPQEAYRS